MEFQPGQSGNPAERPKGSYGGRIRALAALDRMLEKKKNQTVLLKALEKEFVNNPVRFFRTFVMPLLPRESKLKFDREGVIEWRSLVGASDERQKLPAGRDVRVEEVKDHGSDVQLCPPPCSTGDS